MLGTVAGVATAFALVVAAAAPARAQASASAGRWELSAGAQLASPRGWVQVRESEIDGTRLRYGPDLGVRRDHAWSLGVRYRASHRTAFTLDIESRALDGSATLPRDVYFNGTTLAGGATLATRTHFPRFLQFTGTVERRLAAMGNGATLAARAGLTFVALTFVLHGTLAPGSVLRETSEDFVTQELPVPVVGLVFQRPLGRRVALVASAAGGGLPRVNSLRHEGGRVMLSQSHADLSLGLRYTLSPAWRVTGGYHFTHFAQHETSAEDGNDIVLDEHAARLVLAWGF